MCLALVLIQVHRFEVNFTNDYYFIVTLYIGSRVILALVENIWY